MFRGDNHLSDANTVDTNQTPHFVAYDLGLHSLPIVYLLDTSMKVLSDGNGIVILIIELRR